MIVALIVGSKKPPTKWIIVGGSGTTYLPPPTPIALYHTHTGIDWIQRQFSGAIYTNRECKTETDRLVDFVWRGTEYKPNYSCVASEWPPKVNL